MRSPPPHTHIYIYIYPSPVTLFPAFSDGPVAKTPCETDLTTFTTWEMSTEPLLPRLPFNTTVLRKLVNCACYQAPCITSRMHMYTFFSASGLQHHPHY